MLSVLALRKFLLSQPRPVEVRATRDGDVQTVPRGGSWSRQAETLHALQPDLVEVLDANGGVLRAVRPMVDSEASATAPKVPDVIAQDPNAAMLSHFANLIHRSYEHSTTVAFAKMVELVERIDARSDAIEQRLERTERENRRIQQTQIDDAWDRAEELATLADENGNLDLGTMIRTFVQGANQSQQQTRPAASGNGKGRP